ncbi:hypothetical protein RF11_05824 [Thelohanellus kitauei]|uniref:Uncharacterized protein n=1 Tax=Thelohanellus kitauei TaxID=669202 RepID=A0A0C2MHI5_THEKT|nr:hypothetical protein RF11_05824 [Thelohanellus kitauei]
MAIVYLKARTKSSTSRTIDKEVLTCGNVVSHCRCGFHPPPNLSQLMSDVPDLANSVRNLGRGKTEPFVIHAFLFSKQLRYDQSSYQTWQQIEFFLACFNHPGLVLKRRDHLNWDMIKSNITGEDLRFSQILIDKHKETNVHPTGWPKDGQSANTEKSEPDIGPSLDYWSHTTMDEHITII